MAAINDGTITYSREELKDWAKVYHEVGFMNKALQAIHAIETGVKHNTQIVFSNRLGLIGKKTAGCTPNEIDGISLSEKTWSPVFEDFRLKHCSVDVNQQNKLVNQMAKMNPDFYNILEGSQSTIGDYIIAALLEKLPEEILRKAWFNDINAQTISNGGVITDGTDIGYFNTFDGFFKQVVNEIPATAKNYVNIAVNAGASYASQELQPGDSLAILKSMYKKADSRLLSRTDAKFLVTRTIYDGYLNDLENLQTAGVGNTVITENGQTILKFRGYEVVNMELWDRSIQSYENNGVKTNLPNRAVFTVSDNIPIATLAVDDFVTIDAFYDRTLKSNFIDGIYSLDAKHLQSYLTVAAY
jgi:hypothetical protein